LAYSFKISIKKDLSASLKEAEDAIVENGGEFKGDTSNGIFLGKTMMGKVQGEYSSISDNEVEITITKKPFIASKGKIESAIREFFS